MMGKMNYLLPECSEYKGDGGAPVFNNMSGASGSTDQQLVQVPPPENAGLEQKDWDKLDSMVGTPHHITLHHTTTDTKHTWLKLLASHKLH